MDMKVLHVRRVREVPPTMGAGLGENMTFYSAPSSLIRNFQIMMR